ncbi:MAG: ROK family protein [Pirellulales bacterium]
MSTSPHRSGVIALDLGGTKLASAIFSPAGDVLGKSNIPLGDRTGQAVGAFIANEIRRLRQLAADQPIELSAAGVCVPGIVRPQTGRVWAPNIAGWDDYPLQDEIRGVVGGERMKVVVTTDRAASILGEVWRGAAQGCRHAIFLAVGTGIGAGIFADGRVLDGSTGIAGAIGWLALSRPFRQEYVGCGNFESHASGNGLAKVARQLLAQRPEYAGPLSTAPELTAHDVFTAYDAGDEIARDVIAQAIEYWGMASANLISLFNPEKLVFGGGVFGPATKFIDDIRTEAGRWAQPVAFQQTQFLPSQLHGDAALTGTAYLAMQAK